MYQFSYVTAEKDLYETANQLKLELYLKYIENIILYISNSHQLPIKIYQKNCAIYRGFQNNLKINLELISNYHCMIYFDTDFLNTDHDTILK